MFNRIPWTLVAAVCPTCFLAGCNRILDWVDAATDTRLEWNEGVQLRDSNQMVMVRMARLSSNSIAGGAHSTKA